MPAVLGEFSCQILGSLWACMNWDFQEPSLFTQRRFSEMRKAQTAEKPPGHLETFTSQTALPSSVPPLAVRLHGMSTTSTGCRLRTLAHKFLAKSLRLLPSEECPDQSDWDITYRGVFVVIPHPGFSHLPSSSGCLCSSSIQHLTHWWGWCSGTLGGRNGCGWALRTEESLVGRSAGETRGIFPWMHGALSSLL